MADQRLRELERRWKETGADDDAAALILERARTGTVNPDRLMLAAMCGDPVALIAVGSREEWRALPAFAAQLAGLGGREGVVRALAAVSRGIARRLLPRDRPEADAHVDTIRAIEAWAVQPDPRRRAIVVRTQGRIAAILGRSRLLVAVDRVLDHAVRALVTANETELVLHAREGLRAGWEDEEGERARAALRLDLVPWALGAADPLVARANPREDDLVSPGES